MEKRGITLANLLQYTAFCWLIGVAVVVLFRVYSPVRSPWWYPLFGGCIPSYFCLQSGVHLEDARLSRWRLLGIHFDRAAFTNVDLRGAELSGCNFRGARLRNVDLSGARLTDVDMVGAQLERVTLMDHHWGPATYDRRTCWPAGFDPKRHGAKRVE
jgi:hypothetical protein